ncbi:hypothetical protein [Vulcanisaeta sp. JCM 16159]|uniref:hypothetical protein n=1 Tax=Vulcanisaeta sp. JCM 16159 TaxID=1295371 RepID=UPI0006CFAC56|nr:hypothetical protein [Vulcanisaeta sp. JCM 16159]
MSLVYLIKWRECLNYVVRDGNVSILNLSEEGALVMANDDTDFMNHALDSGCTAYARYYRFRVIKSGNLDEVIKIIKPLDLWIENKTLNMVINPLRLSIIDIARVLDELNFELELISEDDVEYTK